MVDEEQFEQQLALYCAPVLKKKKIAGMFHVKPADLIDLERLINHYNELFRPKGIALTLLQTKPRVTVYVYQLRALKQRLKQAEIRQFLFEYDYFSDDCASCLDQLRLRLMQQEDYPHEIGIFLGYPLHDVKGFIEHRPCVIIGYWKVYHNMKKAVHRFAQYDRCIQELSHGLRQGYAIEQLI